MKKNIISTLILTALMLVGCNNVQPTTSSSGDNSTSTNQNVTENAVKIRSIDVEDNNTQTQSLKRKKNANNVENVNYIIIYKTQTDITFTITLDNPEAYAIDAIRVACDDPDSQIMVDGEYKAINMESDGTRVINWASEDPYTKTYNIRTTSQEAINTFEVVDVRLAGHDKFQSKETNSTDLGNNELQIYKMDEDAITLNVIENTMEYIKFDFNIKEGYENIISDINVVGLEKVENEEEYWVVNEGKEYEIEYLYHTEFGDVKREYSEYIGPIGISFNMNNGKNDLMYLKADCSSIDIPGVGNRMDDVCAFRLRVNGTYSLEDISLEYDGVPLKIYLCDEYYIIFEPNDELRQLPPSTHDLRYDLQYENIEKYLSKFTLYIYNVGYTFIYETKPCDQKENGHTCEFTKITGLEEVNNG